MPDPAPPARGEFRLHSAARPSLEPGPYRVTLQQTIDKAPGPIQPVERHLQVTAPRFSLPGTEVLSVFPPPNAEGAFSLRLPQIVLKRRTLPWERSADGQPVTAARPPWLALVVLADGEASFMPGASVEDAMPASVRAALGVTETGRCDALVVSRRVVQQVFPRPDELPLLCHVRQVNKQDTEYVGRDDDGFMAVVISSRLPQPGQRYEAYLISLEGQLDVLPTTAGVQNQLGKPAVYTLDKTVLKAASRVRATGSVKGAATGTPLPKGSVTRARGSSPWSASGSAIAVEATTGRRVTGEPSVVAGRPASFVYHDVDFGYLEQSAGNAFDPSTDLFRFPVLTHWSFSCEPDQAGRGGDFQSLMTDLHGGLLGTPPAPPSATRLRVAPTGHVILEHLTRRGEAIESWYRGPLTPRQVQRRASAAPVHTADQARGLGQDGREDVSEAAAFEVGRLLALSDRRFLRLLAEWRRAGFVNTRVAATTELMPGLPERPFEDGRLWLEHLTRVSRDRSRVLGQPVPVAKGLSLRADDDATVIARGLGLSRDYVAEVLSPTLTRSGLDPAVTTAPVDPGFDALVRDPSPLQSLKGSLRRSIQGILQDAALAEVPRTPGAPSVPGRPPGPPGSGGPLSPPGRPGLPGPRPRGVIDELWPQPPGRGPRRPR